VVNPLEIVCGVLRVCLVLQCPQTVYVCAFAVATTHKGLGWRYDGASVRDVFAWRLRKAGKVQDKSHPNSKVETQPTPSNVTPGAAAQP